MIVSSYRLAKTSAGGADVLLNKRKDKVLKFRIKIGQRILGLMAALAMSVGIQAYAIEDTEHGYFVRTADFEENIPKAEAGEAEPMRIVAVCYQTGTGVSKDLRKAWEWYGKSAAAGDVEAQYAIGTLYRDGIGIKKNDKEAAYWFRKAASHGHTGALINIARQFAEGRGVLKDYRIAAENYWRAAERGSAEGAYCFASMLSSGTGVDKDLPRALKYYTQAAGHHYKDAAERAQKLADQGIEMPLTKKAVKRSASTAIAKNTSAKSGAKKAKSAPRHSKAKKGKRNR